jgi:hypothetical protein
MLDNPPFRDGPVSISLDARGSTANSSGTSTISRYVLEAEGMRQNMTVTHGPQGVDFNNDGGKKAIFRIAGDGKNWAQGVDHENMNYDYLSKFGVYHSFYNLILVVPSGC